MVYDLETDGQDDPVWPGSRTTRPGVPPGRHPDRGHESRREAANVPDSGIGVGPHRPDDHCPARRRSPGAQTAPLWRRRVTISKIYLWDAPSGIRKARLEGSANTGLHAIFRPAGKLLASNGWENRLRLWDAVLGRPVLSLSASHTLRLNFSQDGRIVLSLEDELTTYQVDPALEYRTLAHVSAEPVNYYLPASVATTGCWPWVRTGGLFFGTWPEAPSSRSCRSVTWHVLFEATGDLLTSGIDRRAAVAGRARLRAKLNSASARRVGSRSPRLEGSPRTGGPDRGHG